MKKLAIITTHPIQYYAPVFKLLHERKIIEIKVFYTWGEKSRYSHDPGFEKFIEWDLPLLEGYPFEWAKNTSKKPGSHHFSGIKNPDLVWQISDWDADAVLVFGWAYESHLKVLRHFKNKLPVYFRGDSTLLDETPGLKHFFKTTLLKWIYRDVDHAFYVGMANKNYFLYYGLDQSRLSFTPHAIDNDRFAEDRLNEAQELRNKLGLERNDILILFAGKFDPKKDPLILLNAFKQLTNTNTHLLFAGNGALEKKLKLHGYNSHRIHFLDFQNQTQMPVIYQACDLFCLPSKGPGESWGLAINEAMACGKAILVSDKVGSAGDLVHEGKNGMIFKSGDLIDLLQKLNRLTSNVTNLKEYGKCSKELIKKWSFEAVASELENTLAKN